MSDESFKQPMWRNEVKAIAFDVQGTTADFYQPLLRAGTAVNRSKGLAINWTEVSAEWRNLYRKTLDEVIEGKRPWMRVDQIYRETLDVLLKGRGLEFTQQERDELNAVWSRLDPWPDSVAAAVAIVKHAHLPFDAVLTAELAKIYKPAPAVYQLAVDYLGYRPDQILMVACHKYDLRAAGKFGMRTAFVARPFEFGPGGRPDIAPESWIDCCVDSFTSLADRLGAD